LFEADTLNLPHNDPLIFNQFSLLSVGKVVPLSVGNEGAS